MDGNSKSNSSQVNQNNGFTLRRNSNMSFRPNRKFSEDNILLTAPSFMDLSEMEALAKKIKKN